MIGPFLPLIAALTTLRSEHRAMRPRASCTLGRALDSTVCISQSFGRPTETEGAGVMATDNFVAIDLDRLDRLYRSYRPHRTLATALSHVPITLAIFVPLAMLASMPIWAPVLERNGFAMAAASTWVFIAIVALISFASLWIQYEVIALAVAYLRNYTSRVLVAITQILAALLIGTLGIWVATLPIFDDLWFWDASLPLIIEHLGEPEQRANLITLIAVAPLAALGVWVAIDMIIGSVRLAFACSRDYAAVRGSLPKPSQVLRVRAVAGGTPFYLANTAGRKRGTFLLGIANTLTMIIVVFAIYALMNAPTALFLLVMITVGTLQATDPNAYLETLNIGASRIGPYELSPQASAITMLVFSALLLACVVVGLILAGDLVGRGARRHLTLSYDETRRNDKRPPILFLRSFKNDQVALPIERQSIFDRIVPKFTEARNLDQALLEAATPHGPVIAIGRPGEPKPPFGASRKYVAHAEWQAVVRSWAAESQRIIIVLDNTEGVVWERDMLEELDLTSKTIYLFDPDVSAEERVHLLSPLLERRGLQAPRDNHLIVAAFTDDGGPLCFMYARAPTRSNHICALRWALLGQGYPEQAWARPALA